ncbi:ankyrin repeat family protein [Actinidia rufa]|uniref:Ankyrin repeat family protein n=1 Tax=Actinidia rufa TaxID=165716 RepID=A0A7J0GU60_9ERIC|nr:ankyrin repeat family protein [Actinidia rufa]
MEDWSKYAHSPAHLAVSRRDYATLKKVISTLPRLAKAGEVNTEEESLAAEVQADAVSAVIDRRDVPGRETPLHLAVRLRDPISAEILMAAGADWSLQNENGWSALQEAVCTREENIAMIIARHYQPLAWAKWCRRLPRIALSLRHPEFRGSNLRADMTLAGFDGFRIQRSDQTFLFLGEGYSSEDGNISLPAGSLIVLAHKEKEITNALEGAGAQPTEAEVAQEVALMSQTNMYRPGGWELEGKGLYDMLHVMVSVKSRRVPGAMTDEELFSVDDDERIGNGGEYDDVLTTEERMQLDSALHMGNSDVCEDEDHGVQNVHENGEGVSIDSCEPNGVMKEKKSWFGWNKKSSKHGGDDHEDSKILKKFSNFAPEGSNQRPNDGQKSSEIPREDMGDAKKSKEKSSKKKKKKGATSDSKSESEYKKGLRPVLWLTPDFPLKSEELLPLLDILANKVKAIRRLRELLTTKLPLGTFPVKVAIPIVPTIRVLVTFTKFEERQSMEEFSTPLSSPVHFEDAKSKESEGSTSWISWMRGSRGGQSSDSEGRSFRDEIDPFHIPSDYAWVDANEKKRRMKAKKAKNKKHRKQAAAKSGDGSRQASEDLDD